MVWIIWKSWWFHWLDGVYNCSSLNLVAFAKIMKKYDKVVKHKLRPLYLKEVERTYFASSDEVVPSYLFSAANDKNSNDLLEMLLNWWCLTQLTLLESSTASEGGTMDAVLKHHVYYVCLMCRWPSWWPKLKISSQSISRIMIDEKQWPS